MDYYHQEAYPSTKTFYGKGEKGSPGVGFKLTYNGVYDIQNKKLVSVKQGNDKNDVVTKSQIQEGVEGDRRQKGIEGDRDRRGRGWNSC